MYHLSGALGAVSLSPQRHSTLQHPLILYALSLKKKRFLPFTTGMTSVPVPQGRVAVPTITRS
jgi:hypothetical protein